VEQEIRCKPLLFAERIARAFLQALDEAAEASLYRLLQERLKRTTIISIGHRSTLGAFHRCRFEVVPSDDAASEVRISVDQRAAI
jgi:ABC-type uncharacterized transport system fused permease/ATPase subunit